MTSPAKAMDRHTMTGDVGDSESGQARSSESSREGTSGTEDVGDPEDMEKEWPLNIGALVMSDEGLTDREGHKEVRGSMPGENREERHWGGE